MLVSEIRDILDHIEFRDWRILLRQEGEGTHLERTYLQVEFEAPDNWEITGRMAIQQGRKWYLSPYMTKTEIVNTAWFAVKTAIEHEAREEFKYKGVDIYNTHIDVETLVKVARQEDVRQNATDAT